MRSQPLAASIKPDGSPEQAVQVRSTRKSPRSLLRASPRDSHIAHSSRVFGISLYLPFPGFAVEISSLTQLLPTPLSQQPLVLPGEPPTAPPGQPLTPDTRGRWQHPSKGRRLLVLNSSSKNTSLQPLTSLPASACTGTLRASPGRQRGAGEGSRGGRQQRGLTMPSAPRRCRGPLAPAALMWLHLHLSTHLPVRRGEGLGGSTRAELPGPTGCPAAGLGDLQRGLLCPRSGPIHRGSSQLNHHSRAAAHTKPPGSLHAPHASKEHRK